MPSDDLAERLDAAIDASTLTGAVRVDVDGVAVYDRAFGLAHRHLGVPNRTDTMFGTASVTKGFTALTVVSLIESGELGFDTTARSLLGDDLPLIGDTVTVRHLLGHRSGIGDYLDEEALDADDSIGDDAYLMPVPVHRLDTTEDYLAVLGGHPTKSAPNEIFSYNNGGYVVLALLAERAAGIGFHELVDRRVCGPAGLSDTAFLRGDRLPGRAAVGYLYDVGAHPDQPELDLRTNVLHLPIRGSGDGGLYTTTADLHALWTAANAGRIVSPAGLAEMWTAHSDGTDDGLRYGLGFWIDTTANTVSLHGFDAGVTCVTVFDRAGRFDHTVVANTGRGSWPISERITALLRDELG